MTLSSDQHTAGEVAAVDEGLEVFFEALRYVSVRVRATNRRRVKQENEGDGKGDGESLR